LKHIFPRKNHFLRLDPDTKKGKQLVMAANLDIAILVFAFTNPVFNGKLLDRYLIRTASLGLSPLICMNKVDLLRSMPAEISHLKKLGYRILKISAKFGRGMAAFKNAIKNKRGLLTGPSGVGKSTIIKFLQPGLSIDIGQVRASDGKGRHTTSRSNLYWTDDRTWLIDTPGIKTVTMRDLSRKSISSGFPEIHGLSGACKFRNCSHIDDNGCAVKKAVAAGQVPSFRYESYLRMLEDN
jgi:ribosome biogenesis GTPase